MTKKYSNDVWKVADVLHACCGHLEKVKVKKMRAKLIRKVMILTDTNPYNNISKSLKKDLA